MISVSVIVPTYNRKDSVLRTLDSLSWQTYPFEQFEVIVVDDGSSDGTSEIAQTAYPFTLHYLRQDNQGATEARNHGALSSRGEILVFVDDDIQLLPETLVNLLSIVEETEKTISLGLLTTPQAIADQSTFSRLYRLPYEPVIGLGKGVSEEVPFTACLTGLLAIRQSDFRTLNFFQDPTGGWPNWDDIDFGYRAHLKGYRFVRSGSALAEHWDSSLSDLSTACRRLWKASYSAAWLFQTYPDLLCHIPMFADKIPINWHQDPVWLVARKLTRQVISSWPLKKIMELTAGVLERTAPTLGLLNSLYRWIRSAYVFGGYRSGLRHLHK
jgi:glycosyltransferase involved in cell wall biosynthesis